MHKGVCTEWWLGWKKQCLHTVTLKIFTPHQIVSLVCWQQWDFSLCKAVIALRRALSILSLNPSQIPARWVVRVRFPVVSENRSGFISSPSLPSHDRGYLPSPVWDLYCGFWGLALPKVIWSTALVWMGKKSLIGEESIKQDLSSTQWKIQAQLTVFLPREMWDD